MRPDNYRHQNNSTLLQDESQETNSNEEWSRRQAVLMYGNRITKTEDYDVKKILATATFALMTSTTAFAYDASFDANEYYSGVAKPTSSAVVSGVFIEYLDRDGVWKQLEDIPKADPKLSDAEFPYHLYQEGNYTI